MKKVLLVILLALLSLPAFAQSDASLLGQDQAEPALQANTYYVDPEIGAYYIDEDDNLIVVALATGNETGEIPCALHEALGLDADTPCMQGKGKGEGEVLQRMACWQFTFDALTSGTFPNPFSSSSPAKGRFNLLVLDTSFQFHPATLTYQVFNTLGQLVASGSLGSFNSSPSFDVPIWNGGSAASGLYFIRVTASTSVCGSKTHSYSNGSLFFP